MNAPSQPNVLLVDDHPENLIVLTAVLAGEDLNLVKAGSGEEALKRLLEEEYALILLDVQMPGMDGFETAATIRSREKNAGTPIIFITGISNTQEHIFRGYELGAVDYITKPISPKILRSKVHVFVELFRKTEQVRQQAEALHQMEQREHERALAETRQQLEKADMALETTTSQLKSLIENLDEVYFSADVSGGRLLQISPACEKIYGLPQRAFYERTISWRGLVYPDDYPIRQGMDDDLAAGKSVSAEYRIIRPDAEIRWVHAKVKPTLDAQGRLASLDGIISDITERKRAEQKIREQAALLDIAQDAILITDLQGHILYWNRSAGALYGWTPGEALGRLAGELLFQDAAQFDQAREVVMAGGDWKGELHQRAKQGQELIVDSRWTLVRDDGGNPRSFFVVNTDMTEKRQLLAQFLRAQRMESIGTLAGGIAHDLNNVLAPILMAVQTLRIKVADEAGRKLLDILESCAQRGSGIIKQVLSFARGTDGERTLLQLKYIVTELEMMLTDTFPRSISIETRIPRGLWTINGDATQLYQVLMNLCVNARDAMPQGGVLRIEAENVRLDERCRQLHADARPGSYVAIAVTDTGAGISSEAMDQLFEPFFTTKELGKGTGLGLSTALGIVRSHEGFITVDSEPGRGTRFNVYLPAVEMLAPQGAPGEAAEPQAGNGDLVLVVDDEAANREITRATLETYGYRVMTAGDGREALDMFIRHKEEIGVVITDMMMPNMDGAETIRALRAIDPQTKFIAVSGRMDTARLPDLDDRAAIAFLAKPHTAQKLLATLHQVLKS